ncbi:MULTISPECIES: 2-hydroxy-3-oxopropionate reductase [Paraburkholderia]|uniref:2-hydroxy-3-oxopropionate reductase n=1 Tax=Paraburkholderia TaxID=1822464 RepID=UPI0023B8129C|nr:MULTISPECIES: 2-hydroxy-3-oxopropionate reductase [Paraburkholderia]
MNAAATTSSEHSMQKAGFIGLGIMGKPMAANLLKNGVSLAAFTRSGVPAELTQAGAVACDNAAAVSANADVIFIMVPDTPDVERVLFGENGLASALRAGQTVVDMSSISPMATRDFAARVRETGADYLDAPVSGGEVGAKAGSLTIMVGGEQATFDSVKPLFDMMGKNVTLIGAVGAGQVCKVANQVIVAATIEAVGEALLLASKAGVDAARVREALMGGFASSRILEVHGERMTRRTFDPGFRIELHQKDLNLALSTAQALGVSLPNTAICQALFNACVAHGGKAWDHSAMVRALEVLANHEIGQKSA